jgi:hypothetical protein
VLLRKFHDLRFDLRQNRPLETRKSVITFEGEKQNAVVLRDAETAAHLLD